MQKLRSTVIEGIFGQAKVFHGMARSKFKGLLKVETQFLLTATALNLKKMVKMLNVEDKRSRHLSEISDIIQFISRIFRNWIREIAFQVP